MEIVEASGNKFVALPNLQKKKILEDVVLLRLVLIFLLIWNHAFAPYSGHWRMVEGQEPVALYKWLELIVYNMRLQALIFISGYLLGYTVNRKPESLKFKNCVVKKIKRLIIPSIIFSVFYYVMFYDMTRPLQHAVFSIINGCGHMWFLPMLFWCFLFVFIVERFKISPKALLVVSVVTAVLPWPEIPLRINKALGYFLFFYMGYGIQRKYFRFLAPYNKFRPILICMLLYILAFVVRYFFV